MTELTFSYK